MTKEHSHPLRCFLCALFTGPL